METEAAESEEARGQGARAGGKSEEERQPVLHAPEGAGPLFQRDYVLTVEGSRLSPAEVIRLLAEDFARFSPEELAEFSRPEHPLAAGDTLRVDIRGAGLCGVTITRLDEGALTMRTLEGHPEAGRITFGAECTEDGRLILRIRSRARASSPARWLGWEVAGKHLQSLIWIRFLERLAEATGGRPLGDIIMEMEEVPETAADRGDSEEPTFVLGG
jgi:hypothetical protein